MNSKSTFIIIISLTAFLLSEAQIQDEFIKGYIIKQNGEKLSGFIKYSDPEYNPAQIEFKDDLTSDIQIYTPFHLNEFKVKNTQYISYKGRKDMSPVRLVDLQVDRELRYDTIPVFLKVIITGKLSLYEYHSSSPDKYIYFIKKENEKITELGYQKRIVFKDDKRVIETNAIYKSQLSTYFSDSEPALKTLKEINYNQLSLSKSVKAYNISTFGQKENINYIKVDHKSNKDRYFIKGFLIKLNGDTLSGYINDSFGKYNPDIVEFKAVNSSVIQSFSSDEIIEFKTKNNHFKRFSGKIDKTPVRSQDLNEDIKIFYDSVSVFLKVIVQGEITLYEYHSSVPEKFIYFLQKDNESITELVFQKQIVLKKGSRITHTNDFYKTQIGSYLSDCEEAVKNLQTTNYNLKSIYKRVSIYNNCNTSNYIPQNINNHSDKKRNKHIRQHSNKLSLLFGVSINSLTVDGVHIIDDHLNFDRPTPTFFPKLNFEWIFPGKIALELGLAANFFKKEKSVTSDYFHYEYKFSSGGIPFSLGLKKYFLKNNNMIQPYFYLNFFSGSVKYYVSTTNNYLDYTVSRSYNYSMMPINLRLGAGISFQEKYLLDFSYDIRSVSDKALKYLAFNFLFGYSFNF